jgi:hypothetical protein
MNRHGPRVEGGSRLGHRRLPSIATHFDTDSKPVMGEACHAAAVHTITEEQPHLASRASLALPATLGTFRLEREIGRGATGTVFEAINLESGALVALKVLRECHADGVAHFKEEVRRVSALEHRNLVVPYELLQVDGIWFFAMELIRGTDFVSYIQSARAIDQRHWRLFAALTQLVEAVAALHGAGLLHLDLKPANVLVDADGNLFVLDFGLAQPFEAHAGRRGRVGTPGYWAPEQAAGRAPSPASDCYAIGVMLHEAITGQLPHDLRATRSAQATAAAWLAQICNDLLRDEAAERLTLPALMERLAIEGAASALRRGSSAFVGRKPELAMLAESMERARAREPGLVIIEGESGIGKTRLVEHFLETIRRGDDDTSILDGRCYEQETVPYKGMDIVVERLASALCSLPELERLRVLHEAEPVGEIFPRLKALFPARPEPPAGDVFLLRARALRSLKSILGRLAELRTVVMWIDDMQWADLDTAALLGEVLSGLGPVRLLVIWTCRPAEGIASRCFREWGMHAGDLHPRPVALGPLGHDEALELAALVLKEERSRAPAVVSATGGNPFLVEQVALQAGVSSSGGDLLTVLVFDRLRTAGPQARKLALLAALAGRPLPQRVLFRALGSASTAAHRAITELKRQALIRTHGPRIDDVVEMWHDQIARIALGTLSEEEARGLHRELALSLETSGSHPAELGHHFRMAGENAAARRYYRVAADEAKTALAFEKAAQYYAAAIDVSDAGERPGLELSRADALFNAGRCSEAAPCFVAAMTGAESDRAEQIAARACEAWLLSGHVEEGLAVLAPALRKRGTPLRRGAKAVLAILRELLWLHVARLDRLPSPQLRAEGRTELDLEADISWGAAKGLLYVSPIEGTDFLLRSLVAALRGGSPERTARALGFLGACMFMQIPLLERKGEQCLRRASEIADALGDPYLLAMREIWLGFVELYAGRWTTMLERAERGLTMLQARCVGVAWEAVVAQGICAWAHQFLGSLRDSSSYASEGLSWALSRGDLFAEVMFSHYLAYAELGSGELALVRRRVLALESRWRPPSYTVQHFYSTYLLAMADLSDGRPELAAGRLLRDRKAFKRAGGARTPVSRIDYALLEARIQLSLGDRRLRDGSLRTLAAIAKGFEHEARADAKGHAAFVRAATAARAHRTQAASQQWEQAVRLYEIAGMRLHAACAAYRASELVNAGAKKSAAWSAVRECGVDDPDGWLRGFMPSGLES